MTIVQFYAALTKCAMKIRKNWENDCHVNLFSERKDFVRLY